MASKRTIPEIRLAVRQCTSALRLMFNAETGANALLALDDIDAMMEETKRRQPVRRAKVEAPPITPAFARKIKAYAKKNPEMSYTKIARHFGLINTGRVSEVLAGKRGAQKAKRKPPPDPFMRALDLG